MRIRSEEHLFILVESQLSETQRAEAARNFLKLLHYHGKAAVDALLGLQCRVTTMDGMTFYDPES